MKDFLLLANINAITYKEFFPLLKGGKANTGYVFNKTLEFETPEGETKKQTGICWYTTFPVIHKHLVLTKTYNPQDFQAYDNYDAINVDKVKDIPYDYDGVIGVPITFLGQYSPEKFEILQMCASHGKEVRNIPNENCHLNGKWCYPRILIRRKKSSPTRPRGISVKSTPIK